MVKVKITTAAMKNPTGTVSVYRGKRFVGKAKLLANKDGVVNVKVTKLKKKGTHTLHVKYGGNVQAKGSNSKKFKLKIKK